MSVTDGLGEGILVFRYSYEMDVIRHEAPGKNIELEFFGVGFE
jgi:hypothetical protein